jgi:hydroxyacylglutathione hydrolase
MFFKQFLRDDLGCASYMVGDTDAGVCAVVDPQWDIDPYIQAAAEKGLRITHVIETHNHADHVSGHGKLAARGAEVAIFKDAGVAYKHKSLGDGEKLRLGEVEITILHTPGHRPEHIALAVADTSRADEPWLVLTGDSLFVGAVGRPDLAVEPEEGAAELFKSLRSKLLTLHDGVELYPGHVSGSLCGKAMSPKGSSTIGFERRFNSALQLDDAGRFVKQVTEELPPQPPQFSRIVEMNRGPFLTDDLTLAPLSLEEFETKRGEGALVLDVRSPEAFGGGHIPDALNVDLHGGQFGTRASWLIPEGTEVLLVLATPDDLAMATSGLAAVGQFSASGYLAGGMDAWDTTGRPLATVPQISVDDVREGRTPDGAALTVLDVREAPEWREGHIEGAIHVPFHALRERADELPSNRPIATICGGGTRSSIAASILQREGFKVLNVAGGMDAWRVAGGEVTEK